MQSITLASLAMATVLIASCDSPDRSGQPSSSSEIEELRREIAALKVGMAQASDDAAETMIFAEEVQLQHVNDQAEDTSAIADLASDVAGLEERTRY